ncbi:MAG: lysozyme, partial [Burkholderiaceae bacterium]
MKTSEEGKALIKKFEGCELKAYLCPAQVWTIGYGHTASVNEGDVCTQEDADRMLSEDLEEFE